jgi:invasion protein IalB
MLNKLSAPSLIFCLSLAAAPFAYAETLNTPAPDAAASEEAAPQADPNEPQVFGLWQVRCGDTGSCVASTSLANKDPEGKIRKVVEVRISTNDGKRNLVVNIQSGVLVRPGIEVTVGDQVAKLEYTVCNPGFCIAGAPLSDDMYTAIKKSDVLKAAVAMAPSAKNPKPQKIEFTFKLDGSGAALKAIERN